MPFTFEKTDIDAVIIVKPLIFSDSRGLFFESYKRSEFVANGINEDFVQDNISKSQKGVFRGLHYQLTSSAQGKLVRCAKGKIIDIAVDIRKSSKTFKKYVMVELSEEARNMIYIPPGFAHGFYVMEDNTEVHYKTTSEYNASKERGIIWNDSGIDIEWPDFISSPLLSEKDGALPGLDQAEIFA